MSHLFLPANLVNMAGFGIIGEPWIVQIVYKDNAQPLVYSTITCNNYIQFCQLTCKGYEFLIHNSTTGQYLVTTSWINLCFSCFTRFVAFSILFHGNNG